MKKGHHQRFAAQWAATQKRMGTNTASKAALLNMVESALCIDEAPSVRYVGRHFLQIVGRLVNSSYNRVSAMNDLVVRDGLTEKQRAFVDAILGGASNREAVAIAGYGEGTDPAQVLASVGVQRALEAGCKAVIRGELRPLALKALRELLVDGPAATRYQAARLVLEQAEDVHGDEKPLSEMTISELEAVIERKERQLKVVTPDNGA